MDLFPNLTPLPPLPPRANDTLPRRETTLDPQALEEENKAFLSELEEWYKSQEFNPLFSCMVPDPFLRHTAGLSSDVNQIDWTNMLLSEIRRPRDTQEQRLKMLYRIANFVVKYGIEKPDCELKGMPLWIQYHWARTFHKLMRQKQTKPAQH